jgi:hypothetical protein
MDCRAAWLEAARLKFGCRDAEKGRNSEFPTLSERQSGRAPTYRVTRICVYEKIQRRYLTVAVLLRGADAASGRPRV